VNDENHRDGHDEIDLRVGHPADELSALLDGELDSATEAAVRRHLDGCEPCRAELDEVATVRRALRDLPAMPAPPGFVGQLVDQRRRASRRGVAVTLLAAALALVIGVVAADDPGAPASAPKTSDDESEQVALVDRSDRPFPPAPVEASAGTGLQRWDAGRPGPDAKLSRLLLSARRDSPTGDDGGSVLDRAHEVGREMLDLLGG
jgi:anti-sigma factor RsiW